MQADVTDLPVLADDSFGLVYTGGHVAVWVANIQQYYAEAGRIVKVVEYGEEIGDELWLEKMPAHLLIVGRKEGSA